ncbi:MAG: twin-arginine translocase TatA/TatE family subunit [Alphaproteobacteria bacterium]|nr:twin-arginine translocase TatA/TatE family subunit [Alphaproteobacteria bacterium]
MFGRLGWMEILVIVLLLVILFGHAKIPTMMKNLAGGIKTFKKEMKDDDTKKAEAKKEPVKKESVKKTPVKKPAAKKPAVKKRVVKKK